MSLRSVLCRSGLYVDWWAAVCEQLHRKQGRVEIPLVLRQYAEVER